MATNTEGVQKPSVLVSACLLGDPVRYDGQTKGMSGSLVNQLANIAKVIPICPEMAGGLPVPRSAAEIIHGDGRDVWRALAMVQTVDKQDVTSAFKAGAEKALALAKANQCQFALLMARSPSCGNVQIYDGSFQSQLRDGMGVTTALLTQHGISVFNPSQIEQLFEQLMGT